MCGGDYIPKYLSDSAAPWALPKAGVSQQTAMIISTFFGGAMNFCDLSCALIQMICQEANLSNKWLIS